MLLLQNPTKAILNIITSLRLVPFNWIWNTNHANGAPLLQIGPSGSSHNNHNHYNNVNVNKTSFSFYYIHVILSWALTLFETIQFTRYWNEYVLKGLPPTMYFHLLWLLGTLWISIYHVHFLLYKNEIVTNFNSLVEFNNKLEGIFGRAEYQKCFKKQGIITILLVLSIIETQCSVSFLILKFPNLHQFVVSLIPAEDRSLSLIMLIGSCEVTLYLFFGGPVILQCYLNLYYFYTTEIALKFLMTVKLKTNKKYAIYQSLHLITCLYNDAFGQFMIPGMKLTLGVFTCTSILGFINGLRNSTQPIFIATFLTLSTFSIFTQLFLYPKASLIYTLSSKFCKDDSNSNNSNSKWSQLLVLLDSSHNNSNVNVGNYCYQERRILRQRMIPFGVVVGGMYLMRQGTPATFIDIVINYSLAILCG